jgi:hypothetical protein
MNCVNIRHVSPVRIQRPPAVVAVAMELSRGAEAGAMLEIVEYLEVS